MPIFRPTELTEFLDSLQRAHKRTLSQNFLIDQNVVIKIVGAAGSLCNKWVLEIGPGPGALTEQLLAKNARVIAVELDSQFAQALSRFDPSGDRLHVIEADVLQCCLKDILQGLSCNEITVVSNLPYHLTTPILEWLMGYSEAISSAVLMVQKEVADKLCGKEKASYLQLYVAFFYHIARVCNVSKNSFSPKPKVDSAVVQLTRRDVPIVDSEKRRLFFSFLREAFLKRRKTLVHSLEGIIEREVLLASLQRLNLSAAARVDDLDLSTWIQLFFAGLSPSS